MAVEQQDAGYAARRRATRGRHRARARARVAIDLTPAQRGLDPLATSRLPLGLRVGRALLALAAAIALHGSIVWVGLRAGTGDATDDGPVAIEVRQAPEPPPEPEPPPPEPEPEPPPVPTPPPPRAVEPPPAPEPPPDPKKPPPRLTGLSFDSTSATGGGPAFSTGNTTEGKTDRVANDPKAAQAAPTPPPAAPSSPNQAATRIPSAGKSYVLPKRLAPAKLPYPETLKAQGIEADVTVMVSLDATGKVTKVKIAKASPYPEFNQIAEQAALAERFEPATRDGVAIPYTLSFTYRFRLEDR
jgi:protein TonB